MRNGLSAVLAVSIIAGLAGCKKEQAVQQPAAQSIMNTTVSANAEKILIRTVRADEVGKQAVCPVLKTSFKVSKITQATDYKGKTYYFCCAGCPDEFQKNPDKYIK